jgi:hypothetical protein
MATQCCPATHLKARAHDLAQARYATLSQNGYWVYLCCGDCGARYREAVSVWETELRRRDQEAAEGGPVVTHDRLYRWDI